MNNQGMERLLNEIIKVACEDYMNSKKAIVRLKKKMETLPEDADACEIERTVLQLRSKQGLAGMKRAFRPLPPRCRAPPLPG